MIKTFCRIAGGALLLVGIAGAFAPRMLGMHLTPVHDVVHVLTGLVALYVGFRGSNEAATTFAWIFGAAYMLLGVVGFAAPGLLSAVLGHPGPLTAMELLPDNVVHVMIGLLALVAAAVSSGSAAALKTKTA